MSGVLSKYNESVFLSSLVAEIKMMDHSVGMCGYNALAFSMGFASGVDIVKFIHTKMEDPLVVESNRRHVKELYELLESNNWVLTEMIPQRLWLNRKLRKWMLIYLLISSHSPFV